ncbi:MAG TPA: hypothetical protein VHV83_03160 [Armatimonadota bacterium]|nr:hypothetical protein [Armatimonadota bacterium]
MIRRLQQLEHNLLVSGVIFLIALSLVQDASWLRTFAEAAPRLLFVIFLILGGAYGITLSVVAALLDIKKKAAYAQEEGKHVLVRRIKKIDLVKVVLAQTPAFIFYTLILSWFITNEFSTKTPDTQVTFNTFLPFLFCLGWGFIAGGAVVRIMTTYQTFREQAIDLDLPVVRRD